MGTLTYVETEADHLFTAFLAGVTPAKAQRDRRSNFADIEKRRMSYLVAKTISDCDVVRQHEIRLAIRMAREMRNTDKEV
jgi:hypothetical protein